MTRELLRAVRLLVLPTVALVAVVAFLPGRTGPAARVYALVLCGIALGLALAALARAYPAASQLRPRAGQVGRRHSGPRSLTRLEHEAAIGIAGAFDLHHRLRPRLRELARELLAIRRGVSLDGSGEDACRILGDETWELVREDRPPPEDKLARGLPPATLGRVVDSLEHV
jgi:hypothetical protein